MSTNTKSNPVRLTLNGDYSGTVGKKIKHNGVVYVVLSVESTIDCYQLDGITYRGEYPPDDPDMDWTESVVILRPLSESEVEELEARRSAKQQEAEEKRLETLRRNEEERNRRKESFERFLNGEQLEQVWSGYDLPHELYSELDSPIRVDYIEQQGRYTSVQCGNSLGYWCSSEALTEMYEFAFAYDDDWECRVETFAKPYNEDGDYLAGSEYYRWIKKVKLGQ